MRLAWVNPRSWLQLSGALSVVGFHCRFGQFRLDAGKQLPSVCVILLHSEVHLQVPLYLFFRRGSFRQPGLQAGAVAVELCFRCWSSAVNPYPPGSHCGVHKQESKCFIACMQVGAAASVKGDVNSVAQEAVAAVNVLFHKEQKTSTPQQASTTPPLPTKLPGSSTRHCSL